MYDVTCHYGTDATKFIYEIAVFISDREKPEKVIIFHFCVYNEINFL